MICTAYCASVSFAALVPLVSLFLVVLLIIVAFKALCFCLKLQWGESLSSKSSPPRLVGANQTCTVSLNYVRIIIFCYLQPREQCTTITCWMLSYSFLMLVCQKLVLVHVHMLHLLISSYKFYIDPIPTCIIVGYAGWFPNSFLLILGDLNDKREHGNDITTGVAVCVFTNTLMHLSVCPTYALSYEKGISLNNLPCMYCMHVHSACTECTECPT